MGASGMVLRASSGRRLMMPNFSGASRAQLDTVELELQALFGEVVKTDDCSIIEGARTEEQQAANVAKGVSKTLDSKHVIGPNYPLSRAVDAAPYPVIWPDAKTMNSLEYTHAVGRFYYFAGVVKATARRMGLKIRWGGDWDNDLDFNDQTFDDLDHFEILP